MPIPQLRRSILRDILVHPNTFATTIVIGMVDTYGTEFIEWSPETIMAESEDDFSIDWPQANFDRLMVGVMLLKTDAFYKSLPDFIDISNILSGSAIMPNKFDPADALECAWGITEALLLGPPEDDDSEPFTPEILGYIDSVVKSEGMIVPPDILRLGMSAHSYSVHEFSDDPVLYNAIWDTEISKTQEVNDAVQERLSALIAQLHNLPLMHGDTNEISKQMTSSLRQHLRREV